MQYLCGFVDVKTKWVMVLYSVPQMVFCCVSVLCCLTLFDARAYKRKL